MKTETELKLITYAEAQQKANFSRRTFFKRLKDESVTVYVGGTDRRQRLIDERDLAKMTQPKPRQATAA